MRGRMTKSPVHHKTNYEKKKPPVGHTIMGDVYGPISNIGLNGQKYHLYFIDKGGGLNAVYPMKLKSEALEKFKKYYAFKRSKGEEIKEFQSGQDTELTSQEFKSFLRDKGIHSNTAAPYKHEHTAVINTHIRHTNDLMRAMILHAESKSLGYIPFLHPWAVTHANFIRNRTRLVEREDGIKTRYEWSTSTKPDLSNLCYWGCPGYIRIPEEKRGNKLKEKAMIGYFMGFDQDGKSTLVYIPGKMLVQKTGDFIFDELMDIDPEKVTNDEEIEIEAIKSLNNNEEVEHNIEREKNKRKVEHADDAVRKSTRTTSHQVNYRQNRVYTKGVNLNLTSDKQGDESNPRNLTEEE